jgi:hypothetical protein
MLIPCISLLFLAVAVYFLGRTKPNLFLFDLMKEVCGEAHNEHAGVAEKSLNENPCATDITDKN